MEMLAIAINARKFLKELEESTPRREECGWREEFRPDPCREPPAPRSARVLGMGSRVTGALRSWLRASRVRVAG